MLRGATLLAVGLVHQRRLGSEDDGDDGMSLTPATGSRVGDTLIIYASVLVMVTLSALFSGLTLGLLGLDKTGLEIVRFPPPPPARPRASARARPRR